MHQANEASQPGSRQLRTLVVDPDNEKRRIMELELSVHGQSVVACADARAAVRLFHDDMFQLIVVAHQLPGDAKRFCRDIRALPGGEETTIVVVSDAPTDEDRVQTIAAGADDYIAWSPNDPSLSDLIACIDRTVRSRTESEQASEQGSSERFLVLNPNGTIRDAAPVAERLLGFPPEALVDVNAFSFFHPDDAPQLLSIVAEAFARPVQTRAVEVRVRRDGDSWRTIAVSATNQIADPIVQGIVFDLRGPDVRVGLDDQITRAAMRDRVTDLPNRSLFIDRIDHAVARTARRRQPVVVMVLGFNGFVTGDGQPQIEASEGLVIAIAQRLRSCLRTGDTVARLGRDEFGLLLEEIDDLDTINLVANRIVHAMSVPFFDGGEELSLTPHIGIVARAPERESAANLLRDAGIASAWARVQGAGGYMMFDPSMEPPAGEPVTVSFPVLEPSLVGGEPTHDDRFTVDERLARLNDRIATIEQHIARITPTDNRET